MKCGIHILCMLMILAISAGSGSAEVFVVEQINIAFHPSEVTIQVGDTVIWFWTNGAHTVTNGSGSGDPEVGTLFDEPLTSDNSQVQFVFNEPGVVPYFCRPHEILNMNGVIIVEGAPGCHLNCPEGDGGLINEEGSGDRSPDIDGSGDVTVVDFALFAGVFGTNDDCSDYDCSGEVSVVDFAVFAGHFGHGPGAAGVCE